MKKALNGQIEKSSDIEVMQHLTILSRVSTNGKFNHQVDSGRRTMRKEKGGGGGNAISRSATSAPDSSLSAVWRVTRTHLSNMPVEDDRDSEIYTRTDRYAIYSSRLCTINPDYCGT